MELFKASGLTKCFLRGGRSFAALRNLDFAMREGEFLYITGHSGSGKTTFLNLLAGFLKPTSGEISFRGELLGSWDEKRCDRYRNLDIGYVPQQLGTLPNLTVMENVALPACLSETKKNGWGGSERSAAALQRAAVLLDQMGILDLRDEFPRSLSGGELKRTLLARALMNEPSVLIADEPTADLDAGSSAEIMELLRRVHERGTALLIVTHEEEILHHADRVLCMRDGKLENA